MAQKFCNARMHLMCSLKYLELQVIGKISEMKFLQGWNNWDHLFFTLSAAEMKWSDVSTAILHAKGEIEKIVCLKDLE